MAFFTWEHDSDFLINELHITILTHMLQHLHRGGVLLTEIWVNIGKMITNY